MIKVFHGNDPAELVAYQNWLNAHDYDGYVLDRHRPWAAAAEGGQIHKASCSRIQNYRARALTRNRYKACSTDKAALRKWARYIHPTVVDHACP